MLQLTNIMHWFRHHSSNVARTLRWCKRMGWLCQNTPAYVSIPLFRAPSPNAARTLRWCKRMSWLQSWVARGDVCEIFDILSPFSLALSRALCLSLCLVCLCVCVCVILDILSPLSPWHTHSLTKWLSVTHSLNSVPDWLNEWYTRTDWLQTVSVLVWIYL